MSKSSNAFCNYAVAIFMHLLNYRCWPSKYGLVLERDTSVSTASKSHSGSNLNPGDPAAASTRPLPVWFGLLHPLDDYSRILTRSSKGGSALREMITDTHKIIHVAKDPSMFVSVLHLHWNE